MIKKNGIPYAMTDGTIERTYSLNLAADVDAACKRFWEKRLSDKTLKTPGNCKWLFAKINTSN